MAAGGRRVSPMAAALEDVEPHVLRALRKVIIGIGLALASPFLALTILFLLLDKPLLWAGVTGNIAGALLAASLVAYLVVRAKIRSVRRSIAAAEGYLGSGP